MQNPPKVFHFQLSGKIPKAWRWLLLLLLLGLGSRLAKHSLSADWLGWFLSLVAAAAGVAALAWTFMQQRQTKLALARRQSQRVLRLVEELLEAQASPLHFPATALKACDLEDLVEQALEPLHSKAKRHQVLLRLEGLRGRVYADSGRAVLLLRNLISNAIYSMRWNGGVLSVATRDLERWKVVEVQDQGSGIPAKEREAIFEPFYKLEQRDEGGPGLGLAIAKTIVEQHGGSLGLKSQEGKGSTFWFSLLKV